jgi:maltose alpha-D-glucosyltransferase / alpha-amylase
LPSGRIIKLLAGAASGFMNSNNPKILSFIREYEDEAMLVIINLSRYSQAVELELGNLPDIPP